MNMIVISLAISLFITMILEFMPALFMKNKVNWIKASILCNVVTNPVLNLFLFLISDFPMEIFILAIIVCEIVVLILEANIYKKALNKSTKVCLAYSAIANLSSCIIGSFIWLVVCNNIVELIDPSPIINSSINDYPYIAFINSH